MTADLTNPIFTDEEKAREHFEALRWPNGRVCPHCGVIGESTLMQGKSHRPGLYNCKACRKPFSAIMGTVYEKSHIPLHKWLLATHLMCASKKGISAHQLYRMLGFGSYRTAWFMAHRIREAMKDDGNGPIGGEGMTIEVDETFLGQQPTVFKSGKGWQTKRGTGDMRKIVSLVERGGRARSIHVEDLKKEEIIRALETAHRGSTLMTDQAMHYRRIGREFDAHHYVDHGKKEYGRRDGDVLVTTNTVEGFFSIFKRGMKGVYQHCGEQHLHRYLAEFDFRYNARVALGVNDAGRAAKAVKGAVGKRLTYRQPDRQEGFQAA
jgi:hypothetical protein